nr:hypothetical protein [Jatrophihabitans endophyticus]
MQGDVDDEFVEFLRDLVDAPVGHHLRRHDDGVQAPVAFRRGGDRMLDRGWVEHVALRDDRARASADAARSSES